MTAYTFIQTTVTKQKAAFSQVFCLRALRICTPRPEHLNEEFEHIHNSFSKLQTPESFIHCTESKAINIHKHTFHNMNKNKT